MFACLGYCCLVLLVAVDLRYVNNYCLLFCHYQNTLTIYLLSSTPFNFIRMDSLGYGCQKSNRKLVPPQDSRMTLATRGDIYEEEETENGGDRSIS